MANKTTKSVNFYIDGFNFYYGLKRIIEHQPDWKKFYWIDLVLLCRQFLNEGEEIGKVYYFTSRPKDPKKMAKQNTLLNCNRKINPDLLKVVYGRYANDTIRCEAKYGCKLEYQILEEKETDVNLALQMVIDCFENKCDKVVLFSNDSDFVPPMKRIREYHKNINTMIIFPPGHYSNHLSQICPYALHMEKCKPKFNKSLLPHKVQFDDGKNYEIPESWKIN